MSSFHAVLTAIAICILAAGLEGVCAGKRVKSYFATLRFPAYSAPLPVWYAIGGIYYIVFGFVIYRLLLIEDGSSLLAATFGLIGFMMVANGLSNIVIFRMRNLFLAFVIGAIFPVLDITLFICLYNLDIIAAYSMIPYLIYRVYAVLWGYGLSKANEAGRGGV